MTQKEDISPPGTAEPQDIAQGRNPYILNFCRALAEETGEQYEPEELKNRLDRMYELYEAMLGRNMINSLPEDVRAQYLAMTKDLSALSYEKIGELFAGNISNQHQIMKDTMKEFMEIYRRNRSLNSQDYKASSSARM